jgi:hypothetical protein
MAKRPFAVFDVDGTQFKSACVEKVIDEGIRQGLFLASEFESAFAARRRWQINNTWLGVLLRVWPVWMCKPLTQ